MRDTLFISHATPEDNEFSIWIASRLEMLGYKTWIDKKGLLGGERFWKTIEKEIKDNAIKVLLVYSKNICDINKELKDGIDKEITFAESIAKDEKINDFIIPLNIDKDAPFNAFIGANRLNHIPFYENWADGLKQLLLKLEKDNVPKSTIETNSTFSEWYEYEYVSNCSIVSKPELYYSSWWQAANLPRYFYMYKFTNAEQAKVIRDLNKDISINLSANILSTFEENLNYLIKKDNEEFEVLPENTFSFSLTDILEGFESDTFPQHRDVENYYKRLLFVVVTNLFRKKGLRKFEMSNKRIAFYLPNYKGLNKVTFVYPYSTKSKKKSLNGTFEEIGIWHFAISIQPLLFPFVGFSLKSHLLFSKDGFDMIKDEKLVHSYRRRKGKRFFNVEWRDMQLAFIQYLKDDEGEIKTLISNSGNFLKMKDWPEMFWSEVGYYDPSSNMDEDKIENFHEELIEEGNDD